MKGFFLPQYKMTLNWPSQGPAAFIFIHSFLMFSLLLMTFQCKVGSIHAQICSDCMNCLTSLAMNSLSLTVSVFITASFTPSVSLPSVLCYLCSLLQLCTCLRCVTSCLSLLLPPVRCLYVYFIFLICSHTTKSLFSSWLPKAHLWMLWMCNNNSPKLNPQVQSHKLSFHSDMLGLFS